MYFFSNSPVRCLLTKVVYIHDSQYHCFSYKNKVEIKGKKVRQYLSSASIANEDKLESRHIGVVFHVVQLFVDVLLFIKSVAYRGWEWMGLVERLDNGMFFAGACEGRK